MESSASFLRSGSEIRSFQIVVLDLVKVGSADCSLVSMGSVLGFLGLEGKFAGMDSGKGSVAGLFGGTGN